MHSRYRTLPSVVLGLALLFAVGSSPLSAFAQQDDITVTVPDVEPSVGNTVTLSIEADLGSNEVEGYSNMEFTFNSSAINIVDVREGEDFESAIFGSNVKEDTLTVTNGAENPPVTGSNVEFLQVDVELTQDGGTPFDLTSSNTEGNESTSVFTDENGNELEVTTINQGRIGVLAQAQIIHNAADPAVETVDVYLDGNLAVDDLSFRDATPFVDRLSSGVDLELGVAPGNSEGSEDIIATQTATLAPDEAHTIVANGVVNPDDFAPNPDGEDIGFEFFAAPGAQSSASDGEVDLRAVHGATDAPTVDIGVEDGPTLLQGLTYGAVTDDYLSVTAEETVFTVAPADSDTPIAAFEADLSALDGSAATVLASGFLDPSANQDGPAFALIAALPNGNVVTFQPPTAEAQLIHNAADPALGTVDVSLNGEQAVNNFSFRSATPFVEVPATEGVDVLVTPGGSDDTLATRTVTFNSDEAYTVVANGVANPDDFADNPDGEPIGFEFFVEPGADSTATGGNVDLRAVHGATDAPTVDIDQNGTTLLDNLTYSDVTPNYLSAPAEDTRLVVTPGGSETVVASFDAPLSTLDGSAATVLASGFLDPSANQDGPAFGLIAALPNGNVVTLPAAEVIPIQQARQQGPDSTVTVEGTVTRAFGAYARIQDASGPTGASGLVVRQTAENDSLAQAFRSDISDGTITQGTRLQLTGTLSEFNGLLQVNNEDLDTYAVEGQGSLPAAQEVTFSDLSDNGENYESELIRVETVLFEDPSATGGTLDAQTSYDVEDGDGTTFTYRVQTNNETEVIGTGIPNGTFTYEGVVGEFDGQYQLIPVRSSSGLPVEMAGFEATRSGSSVELRWSTASETNNAGFRVQHEPVGQDSWQEVGFVESQAKGGTTTEAQTYRYSVQQELEPGTHRFRLQQQDLDGSTSLSDVVSVEVQMRDALTLRAPAPNPTTGQATVTFAVKEATDAEVVLYDMLGQQVRTLYEGTPAAGQAKALRVRASDLPSGTYMVQLRADGQTRTQRLIVVR